MTSSVEQQTRTSLLAKARRFFQRAPLPRTRVTSIVFAATATALPLAILIGQNADEIARVEPIVLVAAVAALIAGLGAALLGRVVAPHVAGIIFAVLGYAFFSMSWTESQETVSLVVTWLGVSGLGSAILMWLIGDSTRNVALAAMVTTIGTIAMIGVGLASPASNEETVPQALGFTGEFERTPNVYIFVPDGFGNPRVIEDQLSEFHPDLDFSDRIDRLTGLGFEWEEQARSNYAETRLSVPSTLNADFPLEPGPEPNFEARFTGERALQGHNRLTETFISAGYEYWHSSSGLWGEATCDITVATRCLGSDANDVEALEVIWGLTPLRAVLSPSLDEAQDPGKVVDAIEAARAEGSTGPYLVFSHLLLPHSPYRLDQDCNAIDSESTTSVGSELRFRGEYAGQALCTATMLADAMERLVEIDPTAVILVQADHGASFLIDSAVDRWSDASIRERMDILRLTRLPEDCRHDGLAAQSLINTLPLLHSCLTETEPEFIEPRLIITNFHQLAYEAEHPDDIGFEE